ncbi:jg6573 [Pararge aegeria aegeria]|uniref:Jg6573 protein n=1 Tax=Pararge aegeria aegeria TaxID=348720 RepID=A0A8S4R6Z2_9NEOP|nr:jg6573 [Pararge aegeria aegeria]
MRRNSGSSATGLRGEARAQARDGRKSFAHARTQMHAQQCAPSGSLCACAPYTHTARMCACLSSRSINELDIDSDCCLHATH